MAGSVLLTLYEQLPELQPGDDEELWAAGVQEAMRHFRDGIMARYTEGTLQRLLTFADVRTRRAAVLALGLVGTMTSNAAVAAALHDSDPLVRRLAADALWELWFRGGTAEQNRRLQQALQQGRGAEARRRLDALIREAPQFAEAYNQRAIWFYHNGEYARAVDDCQQVLRLNPHHYAAAAGLGQCFLKLGRPRAALHAFRTALAINPDLDYVRDVIQALEQQLEQDQSDD
ncbi:MAG: tetratricopeptide repeat protein [Gemmataceae bacterium]|nr:tetratricopeptide repeat protein [Gemmataceae bacterium]MCS7271824.1 tetratricopeptide repeat protein [Gemmataceae bacterium]MDW8243854.1 tetratricopeptide repeat protein [Thermogemmata sp.]